jgi:hypothetical protein
MILINVDQLLAAIDAPHPEDLACTSVYVNMYGVKQLANADGEDICIGCNLAHTNRGDGMLCDVCQHLLKDHMEEFQ